MELKVDDYGRTLFSMMTRDEIHSERWKGIEDRARPLVEELIKLGEEAGYDIIGYTPKDGKPKLSKYERIEAAYVSDLKCEASDLKDGDKIWVLHTDPEMHLNEHEPSEIKIVGKGDILYEFHMWDTVWLPLGYHGTILVAPKDWDEKHGWDGEYGEEYWLKRADELGI